MIRLQKAQPGDTWLFFTLRNDPEAIQNSRGRSPISVGEHEVWWEQGADLRWVAYDGPVTVGILRINPNTGWTSIIVVPKERGKGLGTEMLEAILPKAKEAGLTRLRAEVLESNLPSQRAFTKAGWKPVLFEVTL